MVGGKTLSLSLKKFFRYNRLKIPEKLFIIRVDDLLFCKEFNAEENRQNS